MDGIDATGKGATMAKGAVMINKSVWNIFNGLLRVPVNEKIPALNLI